MPAATTRRPRQQEAEGISSKDTENPTRGKNPMTEQESFSMPSVTNYNNLKQKVVDPRIATLAAGRSLGPLPSSDSFIPI